MNTIEQVSPETLFRDCLRQMSLLVAATIRTSACKVRLLPSRSNVPSCNTRNSFAWISNGMSPISSSSSVPPSAIKTAWFTLLRPVKRPFPAKQLPLPAMLPAGPRR